MVNEQDPSASCSPVDGALQSGGVVSAAITLSTSAACAQELLGRDVGVLWLASLVELAALEKATGPVVGRNGAFEVVWPVRCIRVAFAPGNNSRGAGRACESGCVAWALNRNWHVIQLDLRFVQSPRTTGGECFQ